MTTTQFRKDAERVARMRAVLEIPIMQEWLSAMRESGPDKESISEDISPQKAHINLGEARGYARYHNQFKLGGTHAGSIPNLEEAALTSKLQPEEF